MRDRFGLRLMGGILVVAALFAAGFYCYNLGLSQGVAEAGRAVAGPSGGAPVFVMWPRPWGVGFGLFPFFPLLFILFWFFVARGLFWRGGWRGRGCDYGSTEALNEWHRRAHAEPQVDLSSPRSASQ